MAFKQIDTNCMYIASKDILTYSPAGILKKGSICKQDVGKVTFCDLETNSEFLIQSRNFYNMIGDKFLADVYDKISAADLQSYVKIVLIRKKASKVFLPITATAILLYLISNLNLNSTLEILLGYIVIAIAICPFLICWHILKKKRAQIMDNLSHCSDESKGN